MFDINWHITIGNYKLTMLDSVEIVRSVEQLSDTATIVLPGSCFNKAIEIEQKIRRGNKVTIQLGYNGRFTTEFEGYLESIATDDGSISLKCEDPLFTFRVPIQDKELVNPTVTDILNYVLPHGFDLKCDYAFKYDKYVIKDQTSYQVLKKIQEETKANIYLKGTVLHVHSKYQEIFGFAEYSFQENIEESDLKYMNADERKLEVTVEGKGRDGKVLRAMVGEKGGDVLSWKINGISDLDSLYSLANEQLKTLSYTGYSGSFDGWLEPYCDAGYSVLLTDTDYEYKSGKYYVLEVQTKLSASGGERTIKIGKKL
jgi:hypothetical protein